ncbi:probable F-box protein At5g04010 isoform X2 [Vicia villosa]|uniref:probable F-box protein At5g04010 isoform X2 n=1 Tax=Vicia villosa TaxID=3911 RepID=UPI00273B340E|nr:probable F-box protein At5g04010 isoform X2 [Vicia villosa]
MNIKIQTYIEMKTPSATLSWEVLILVAHHLDPKTLAIASCVSKSWLHSMSSDQLWKPIVTANFPSLSTLPSAVSYCRLYALGHSTAIRRRQIPSKPTLSLSDLVFAVSITSKCNFCVVAAASRSVDALVMDPPGVFSFGVGFEDCVLRKNEGLEEVVRVTWNVVVKGWRGVFTLMDCERKVRFVGGGEEWFSEELPAPSCCSKVVASSVVADVKVVMCDDGGGKVRVEKVSMGILSVVDWSN